MIAVVKTVTIVDACSFFVGIICTTVNVVIVIAILIINIILIIPIIVNLEQSLWLSLSLGAAWLVDEVRHAGIIWHCTTVDGSEILHHLGCLKPCK